MASNRLDRLKQEVGIEDLPRIELGAFNWQPVEKIATPTPITSNQQPVRFPKHFKPADSLTPDEFPLNMLENKTFAGTGYNVVWRPRSFHPLPPKHPDPTKKGPPDPIPLGTAPDVLQLNLTAESLAFSGNIGDVPNRGSGPQADLLLKGLPYIQRVGAFENDETGSDDLKDPLGIHFEPGVFMFVPKCEVNPPNHPATINRMASIPHGTTINAQGGINQVQVRGKPDIAEKVSIFPFAFNAADPIASNEAQKFKQQLGFGVDKDSNRLPANLNKFSKTITKDIFDDPNEVLRKAIADQNIDSFVRLDLTTSLKGNPQRPKASPEPIGVSKVNRGIVGGGTANIGFLQGTDDLTKAGDGGGNQNHATVGNAHAAKMTVTYWIETLSRTLTIQPKTGKEQVFPTDVSAAGVLGPTFFVSKEESDKISSPVTKTVPWTQIQYSQNVTLNFNGFSWPHISVATLGDVSRIPVTVTPDKPASRVPSVL